MCLCVFVHSALTSGPPYGALYDSVQSTADDLDLLRAREREAISVAQLRIRRRAQPKRKLIFIRLFCLLKMLRVQRYDDISIVRRAAAAHTFFSFISFDLWK